MTEKTSKKNQLKSYEDAVAWLKAHGYKISRTKFAADFRAGLVPRGKQGKYQPKNLIKYAIAVGLDRHETGAPNLDKVLSLQEQKTNKEIQKLEEDIRRKKFENDLQEGRYIEREQLELELAARAGVFYSMLRTRLRGKVKTWIQMAKGKQVHGPKIIDDAFEMVDDMMNEFARMDRFHVLFGEVEEVETDDK